MRFVTLVTVATVAAAASIGSPAMATTHTGHQLTFDDCYRLGWSRGVHLELGEMPGFVQQCLNGTIPFNASSAFETESGDDTFKLAHKKHQDSQ